MIGEDNDVTKQQQTKIGLLRDKKAACVTQTAQQSIKRRAMMAGPD
jgi:hypothetical protein